MLLQLLHENAVKLSGSCRCADTSSIWTTGQSSSIRSLNQRPEPALRRLGLDGKEDAKDL